MLEWFSSKFAALVTIIIMISSILGFFKTQHENFKEQELQSIADNISSAINTVSSYSSELKLRIKHPPEINGKNYKVELTPNLVIVTYDNIMRTSKFTKRVCLWNPCELKYITPEKLELANSLTKNISCNSYEDFFVENKLIDFSTGSRYLTFLYPKRFEPFQKEATFLANEINNFVKTVLNASTLSIKKEFVALNQISFYRGGIFIMKEHGSQACGFVNYDYLWNPINLGTQTTSDYLNETDELLGERLELVPNEVFWAERKLLELVDIELENGVYKSALFTFLYK